MVLTKKQQKNSELGNFSLISESASTNQWVVTILVHIPRVFLYAGGSVRLLQLPLPTRLDIGEKTRGR